MSASAAATPRRDRLLRLGAAMFATLALVVVVRLVPRQLMWGSNPGATPRLHGEIPLGEAEGWVKKVEPRTKTIHLSSGFLGFGARALAVSDDTQILVGDKVGAFGDIREGRRIRVSYEARPDTHLARSIEVLVDQGAAGRPGGVRARPPDAGISSRPDREPKDRAPAEGPPAADRPVVGSSPAETAAAIQSKQRPATASREVRAANARQRTQGAATRAGSRAQMETGIPTRSSAAQPAPRTSATRQPPASAASPGDETERQIPSQSGPTDTATPPSEGSREPEGSDPAAAIDWLLKEYKAREP